MNIFLKIFIIFLAVGLILSISIFAQEQQIKTPETVEETAKKLFEAIKNLPKILVEIFKEEVLPFWKRIWDWFLENVWQRLTNWLKRKPQEELEKRIETGIEEEKKELEEEKRSLWQKFQDWFKRR